MESCSPITKQANSISQVTIADNFNTKTASSNQNQSYNNTRAISSTAMLPTITDNQNGHSQRFLQNKSKQTRSLPNTKQSCQTLMPRIPNNHAKQTCSILNPRQRSSTFGPSADALCADGRTKKTNGWNANNTNRHQASANTPTRNNKDTQYCATPLNLANQYLNIGILHQLMSQRNPLSPINKILA